jgi:hypothetical protein
MHVVSRHCLSHADCCMSHCMMLLVVCAAWLHAAMPCAVLRACMVSCFDVCKCCVPAAASGTYAAWAPGCAIPMLPSDSTEASSLLCILNPCRNSCQSAGYKYSPDAVLLPSSTAVLLATLACTQSCDASLTPS